MTISMHTQHIKYIRRMYYLSFNITFSRTLKNLSIYPENGEKWRYNFPFSFFYYFLFSMMMKKKTESPGNKKCGTFSFLYILFSSINEIKFDCYGATCKEELFRFPFLLSYG